MKRMIKLLFVILLFNLLNGCAYYSKMAVPGEPGQQKKYKILKHIKKTVTGTRFLTIPINIPSSAQIIKNEVSNIGGDGIINVEITFSEFNFWLFSFPIVEVEGDIVKILGQFYDNSQVMESSESKSLEISESDNVTQITSDTKPSSETVKISETREPTFDSNEFSKWKKKVYSVINTTEFHWNWKSFRERNAVKLSKKEWVESLVESEYIKFLKSGKTINKWLEKRLSE